MREQSLAETRKEIAERCQVCNGRGFNAVVHSPDSELPRVTFTDFYTTRSLQKCECTKEV